MSNLRYLPSSNHRQKFCLHGFSESWTWRRRRNFPLPWISSSCGHSELNEALSHSCRIVSHESWFCRKSPGTLLLCFYWRFIINQRREVLAKLWKQKKPLHFSASVSSLNEWMKPLRIDLKLVRRLPKIPILKSVWGFSVFRNSSPAMVSDVTCIGKILITKLNRKIVYSVESVQFSVVHLVVHRGRPWDWESVFCPSLLPNKFYFSPASSLANYSWALYSYPWLLLTCT